MRRIIVNILSVLFLVVCACLCACGEGGNGDTDANAQGEYVIRYYFENGQGEFVHDESKDETGTKDIGATVSVRNPKTFDGYTFDKNNDKNWTYDIIREDKTVVLSLYYTLNEGGAGSNTPDNPNPPDTPDTPSEPSEPSIPDAPENVSLVNTHYVKARGQEVKATVSVSDANVTQGVVSLYNTAATINALNAKESYYLFATQGGKALLSLYNGENLVEIKSADITPLGAGNHEYKMQIDANGSIVCSLDNNQVLSVTESDFTAKGCATLSVAGRVGTYNAEGASVSVVAGDMTMEEIKEHFQTVVGRVSVNYYVFNATTLTIENRKEEIPFSWIYGFGAQAEELKNKINNCSTVAGLIEIASNNEERKVQATQQHLKASFGSFIQLYNDSLLMPMISATQVEVKNTDTGESTGVFMSADVYARDTRWWIPNAYMLYSTWPAPNDMGVMDMLEYEVNETTDFNALYALADKYIDDVVKALSYKGLEFYFWHEYNKNPNSVLPQWWFLYTYIGAKGEGFVYAGDVFKDYTWTKDYRLSNVFFDTTNEAYSTDPQTIMNNYAWMLNHQTLADVSYTVNLNAMGGTLDSATLTNSYSQALALPTPTKAGASFGGWFYNRAYEGAAVTQIPQYAHRTDIHLYAKWIVDNAEQTLAVAPADVIGNDMVIQQNKPFNVFGTGVDGTSVTVNLDGVTKTTTVANGKWSVTFEAMQATWTAKTLTISGGGVEYSFGGILVGEVWLGAGQSNMQMTLSWMNGTGVNYVGQYGYYDNFNKIRMYRQQIPGMPFVGDESHTNTWVVANCPNEAAAQSAYMVSFALNLQKKLGVPVGVIVSAQGATYIEEWLSSESIATAGSMLPGATEDASGNPINPDVITSRFYYGMTELLRGVQVAGVVWYQGCNNAYAYNYPAKYPNAKKVDYAAQLQALHSQYKDVFGNENIPMIVTELAPYAWDDYEDFRIKQRNFVTNNANTYLLSTVDIGTPYDIHPVFKNELGKRAANIALEFTYKAQDVSDTLSYVPVSATQSGNTITLTFEQGKTIFANGALIGFKVENEQGVLQSVTATVSGNTVTFSYTGNAVNVYYMYVKNTVGQFDPTLSYYIGQPALYGGNGLPVAPFVIAVS